MSKMTIRKITDRPRSNSQATATVEAAMIQACATVYAAVYVQARNAAASPLISIHNAQDAVRSFINTMDLNE